MQSLTTSTRRTAARRWSPRPLILRALDRLIAADRAYRERSKMRRLSDEQLRDMGLSRRDAPRGRR
ncbi:MAG: hypothetical protein EP318_11505 [Rhodobacteraceae bacterium]|nr:MAG: hypothetical protein EP318_11505 [Paracoccaceae bacterium]